MDVGEIKKKAIDKGIITEEEVKDMGKDEILMLTCRPGFSTSKKITETSGRGVGLDVVKAFADSFGASFEIKTELHKGSKFIIHLPPTMAILLALLVKVGDERYAIPITDIKEVVEVPRKYLRSLQKIPVFKLRDEVILLYDLHKFLDVKSKDNEETETVKVAVLKSGNKGIILDSFTGIQEVVVKSLNMPLIRAVMNFSGASILGDGKVILILNLNTLLPK